jgi:hypothetical protein
MNLATGIGVACGIDLHLQLRSAGTHAESDTDNLCYSFLRLALALLSFPSAG